MPRREGGGKEGEERSQDVGGGGQDVGGGGQEGEAEKEEVIKKALDEKWGYDEGYTKAETKTLS